METVQTVFSSFFDAISSYFRNFSFTVLDALDILFVAVLFYYTISFVRSRHAGRLFIGIVLLIVLQVVGILLNMRATQFVMQTVFQVGLTAIVVVFQPELRSMLEKVGGDSIRGIKGFGEQNSEESVSKLISDVCDATAEMSAEKVGALIVIERKTSLSGIIDSGTVINAESSSFLIRNIFFKNSPLHDGALVIRKGRLYAAGCLLPLSDSDKITKDLGTRHRAGIGVSELGDAVVVIVSEESGVISVAVAGELKRYFDFYSLKKELNDLLSDGSKNLSMRETLFRRIAKNDPASSPKKNKESGEK